MIDRILKALGLRKRQQRIAVTCTSCHGWGMVEGLMGHECPKCQGKGWVEAWR